MAKDSKIIQFLAAREDVIENLEAIQLRLAQSIELGMIDRDDYYYNELLDLLKTAALAESRPALEEVITKAKTIEIDVDAWLALHGQTTISLPWPKLGS